MQSRIDALKHEVKKLEAENFKIKSLLKQKLSSQKGPDEPQQSKSPLRNKHSKLSAFVKASQMQQVPTRAPSKQTLHASTEQDEFYQMVKYGFLEQMKQQRNALSQQKELYMLVSDWIANQFRVNVPTNLKVSELKATLDQLTAKFEKDYMKKTQIIESSIGDNSSFAHDTVSLNVQSEIAGNFLRKSSDTGVARFHQHQTASHEVTTINHLSLSDKQKSSGKQIGSIGNSRDGSPSNAQLVYEKNKWRQNLFQ